MSNFYLNAIAARAREAKERADGATEGPWTTRRDMRGLTIIKENCIVGENICYVLPWPNLMDKSDANALFITTARDDVPALADDVLALVEYVRDLDAAIGPVMPETPPESLMNVIWKFEDGLTVYDCIRAALAKEQAGG